MAKKTGKQKRKLVFFLAIVASIFILDRLTKWLSFSFSGCFFFCVKQSVNFGAAFALFSNFPWIRIWLISIALIVLLLIGFCYFRIKKFTHLHTGLILLFSGTLANLIDRFFYGYIIDFLSFSFLPQFPAFNIADVCNVAGVIFLIVYLLKKR